MRGWEPTPRRFDQALSDDPLGWVAARLRDLGALLAEVGVSIDDVDPADAEELGQAVPEIVAALERLLSGVHAGRLALAPAGGSEAGVREGWL